MVGRFCDLTRHPLVGNQRRARSVEGRRVLRRRLNHFRFKLGPLMNDTETAAHTLSAASTISRMLPSLKTGLWNYVLLMLFTIAGVLCIIRVLSIGAIFGFIRDVLGIRKD